MRGRFFGKRRGAAVVAGMLALAMVLGAAGAALAQDADEEEVPLDTKLFRQFLKDLGLQGNGDGIEYRERAPLVVPPSRSLPQPQNESLANNNPAWPKDPDVKQRKAAAAKKNKPTRTAAETMDAEGRPLSRSELEKGRGAAGTPVSGSASPEEGARVLRPSELGSRNIFSDMFSSFGGDKAESAPFTGEPQRESLTAPPTGYQTPSPSQPYGIGPKREVGKALTPEERATGEMR